MVGAHAFMRGRGFQASQRRRSSIVFAGFSRGLSLACDIKLGFVYVARTSGSPQLLHFVRNLGEGLDSASCSGMNRFALSVPRVGAPKGGSPRIYAWERLSSLGIRALLLLFSGFSRGPSLACDIKLGFTCVARTSGSPHFRSRAFDPYSVTDSLFGEGYAICQRRILISGEARADLQFTRLDSLETVRSHNVCFLSQGRLTDCEIGLVALFSYLRLLI